MTNRRDLALAYSPGVAVPCLEFQKDPPKAYEYTSKANLVAVISNGTAVLGLGNIGAMAGKPVMEGKGCLFQKFAGIVSAGLANPRGDDLAAEPRIAEAHAPEPAQDKTKPPPNPERRGSDV